MLSLSPSFIHQMQLVRTSYVQDIKPGLGQKQVRREGISQCPPGVHSLVRRTDGGQTHELYCIQASVRDRRRKDCFQSLAGK